MEITTNTEKIIILALLIIFGLVASCDPGTSGPASPIEKITISTANKADWLTIVGAVTCALGVYSYLAGNSASVNIIAAGITLSTIGLLIASFAAALAEYREYFLIGFVVLGVLAFFTFVHAIGDVNRDGKIDWRDIVALFFKTKPKPKT